MHSIVDIIDTSESADDTHTSTWQQELANVIRTPQALLDALELPKTLLNGAQAGADTFPIRVPWSFVERMKQGDPDDPLLKQVLPLSDETDPPPPGYVLDPLGEVEANAAPGIVHKYTSRVLLITNGACAVHCRYCFRRHFPYDDNNLSVKQWQESLDYVAERPEINEVILSGGDPLSSPDSRLFKLFEMIEAIPHVTRLRIHTRLPVVIPSRVTDELVQRLTNSRLKVVMVIHANHANELDAHVATATHKLHHAGIHVLNQSVLMKGINDSVEALTELSERLFSIHVMPYYLHFLDPVVGTHHFHVELEKAQKLHHDLHLSLPGFLVPKLIQELAGQGSKTPIPPLIVSK